MSTPNDREFSYWHRVASESLLNAAIHEERVPEQLDIAEDYGRRALRAGDTARERMLAMGLLTTVTAIRVLYETGLKSYATFAPEDREL